MSILMLVHGCQQITELQRIQQQGEIKIITKLPAITVNKIQNKKTGLEYELLAAFAKEIGVKINFIDAKDIKTLLADIRHAKAHMAAANLTDTPKRRKFLRFSLPFQYVNEHLIYRRGNKKPASLADIPKDTLHILEKSSHAETLEKLQGEYPGLKWVNWPEVDMDTLLQAVEQGDISYTVANSNALQIAQQTYSHLLAAFEIASEKSLAWAFPKSSDGSLQQAANSFLRKAHEDGTIQRLQAHYYGHINQLNYVDKQFFRRHILDRLPQYRHLFMQAAQQTGIDWRLLAAISYQESHWRADAVSPTGVRGLMMLTKATAKRLGIKDRTNPYESILGGAQYLRIIERKIPKRIDSLDRLWLTLASYNVGFGHLEDARILTQRQGGNPDLWLDVKKYLPLLRKKEYYSTLKYGFARGNEPVTYVENIRNYYDLLIWYESNPDALTNDRQRDTF